MQKVWGSPLEESCWICLRQQGNPKLVSSSKIIDKNHLCCLWLFLVPWKTKVNETNFLWSMWIKVKRIAENVFHHFLVPSPLRSLNSFVQPMLPLACLYEIFMIFEQAKWQEISFEPFSNTQLNTKTRFFFPIKKLFFPQKKLPSIFSAQIIVGFLILLHCNLIERRAQRRLDSLDYFPAQLATIVWFIIFHFFKARPLCFLAEHNTWDIQLQHNSQN